MVLKVPGKVFPRPGTPGQAMTLADAYDAIKALEANFPLPTPTATLRIGTFNAATGAFSGLKSTLQPADEILIDEDRGPGPDPKLPPVKVPPRVEIDAVNVVVEFEVINGAAQITANGITKSGNNGIIAIDVGTASHVTWIARNGTRVAKDEVVIERPPIIGAGVFEIPALPVAVIYEPPSRPHTERQPNNRASYSATSTIGNTITVSLGTGESTTTPVPTRFTTLQEIGAALESLSGVANRVGFEGVSQALSGIATVIDTVLTATGGTSVSATSGTTVTNEHELSLSISDEETISTGSNDGGPGVGDIIYFLRNAKLVWLASSGKVTLALLGHDGKATRAAGFLLANQGSPEVTGVDDTTADALLALDPFVAGGATATLAASRFAFVEHYEPNGSDIGRQFSITLSQADLQAKTTTTSRATEFREGALSFLGIGVTEDQTVTTTVTHKHSSAVKSSQTVRVTVDLLADIDELYAVDVYYDRVFGTFAFQEAELLPAAVLSGITLSPLGKPMAHTPVTVVSGGRKYSTRTDSRGRWSLRTPAIKDGSLTVTAGKAHRTLLYRGAPILDIELR